MVSRINLEDITAMHKFERDTSGRIFYSALTDGDMRTIDGLQALFPHWKRLSVIKKIRTTMNGENMRFIARRHGTIIAYFLSSLS